MANILSQFQIKSIVKIALEAGEIAMSYFGGGDLNISKKLDDSPLTIADSLISKLICQRLKNIEPKIPVICEEGGNRDFGDGIFWLIDPIDGTSSFIENNPEFTINIALIKNKKPVFGLIFAPAIADSRLYYTNENGDLIKYFTKDGTEKTFIFKKRAEKDFMVITSKRSSDSDILNYVNSHHHKNNKPSEAIKIYKVSSSLKFLYLIEGKADLYLHLRRSMEWDIAAGQALILAAGGEIVNLDGSEFLYEKAGMANQPFLVVF